MPTEMPRTRRLIPFIVVIQTILFLAHFFLYESWTFSPPGQVSGGVGLKLVLGLLSVSFMTASVLAFRYANRAVRALYKVSAVWMGLLSFLLIAAAGAWIIFG